MPRLFSYGSLQDPAVQRSTFGRALSGERDALLGAEPSTVEIGNPETVATLGRTHHANVTFTSETDAHVPGTVFEITEEELNRVDEYEAAYAYRRVRRGLASGNEAWVYVYADAYDTGEGC